MVNKSELGKLKFEGCFDKSYYLGKKQRCLINTETGKSKVNAKGYNNNLLKEEDWEPTKNFFGDALFSAYPDDTPSRDKLNKTQRLEPYLN